VVLGEKPNLADDSYNTYDDNLVSSLINHISTLSSIYHKTPEDIAAQQSRQLRGGATLVTPSTTPIPKKEEEAKEEEAPQSEEPVKASKKRGKKKDTESEEEEEVEKPKAKLEKPKKKTTKTEEIPAP
jgi:hypothetical protein